MIRRPPRSTRVRSSAASDVYKRQDMHVRTIQTSRLLLRPWSPEDADFLFDMESRWDVKRYIGAAPAVMTNRSEALASIERRRALNHPVYGIWAIELLS